MGPDGRALVADSERPAPDQPRSDRRRSRCAGCASSRSAASLDEERKRPQPLRVDLDVELDVAASPRRATTLADTVGLRGAVRPRRRDARTRREPRLLEAACDRVGTRAARRRRPQSRAVTRRRSRSFARRRRTTWTTVGVRRRARCARCSPTSRSARNLGDRAALAARRRRRRGGADAVRVSPVYETEPVGGPGPGAVPERGRRARDRAPRPASCSARCRAAEVAARRVRSERFGPRTLDADVLLVGDLVVDDDDLVVPHPRMWQRRFVLAAAGRPRPGPRRPGDLERGSRRGHPHRYTGHVPLSERHREGRNARGGRWRPSASSGAGRAGTSLRRAPCGRSATTSTAPSVAASDLAGADTRRRRPDPRGPRRRDRRRRRGA